MRILFTFLLVLFAFGSQAQEPKLMLPAGHTGGVSNVIFSPDERYVATSSSDEGTVKIWNSNTGVLLSDFKSVDYFSSLVFTSNSRFLLFMDIYDSLNIWDIKKDPFGTNLRKVSSKSFCLIDSNLVALATPDSNLLVYEIEQLKIRERYKFESLITDIEFSKRKHQLLIATENKSLILWELNFKKSLLENKEGENSIYKISEDGAYVITSKGSDSLEIRKTTTLSPSYVVKRNGGMSFTKDDKHLLYHRERGKSYFIEVETGKEVDSLLFDRNDYLKDGVFSNSGKYYAAEYKNTSGLSIWNMERWEIEKTIDEDIITSFCFSKNEKTVLVGLMKTPSFTYDLTTQKKKIAFSSHVKHVNSLRFLKNGQYLITDVGTPSLSFDLLENFKDNEPKVWDLQNATLKLNLNFQDKWQNKNLVIAPNETFVVTLPKMSDTLEIWHIDNNKTTQFFYKGGYVAYVAISPDSRFIGVSYFDSTIVVLNASSGQLVHTLHLKDRGALIHYSKNGKYFISTSGEKLQLWDAKSYNLLKEVKAHPEEIKKWSFSAADDLIAVSGPDQTFSILKLPELTLVKRLTGYPCGSLKAYFNWTGKYLYTSCRDEFQTFTKVVDVKSGKSIFQHHTEFEGVEKTFRFVPQTDLFLVTHNDTTDVRTISNGALKGYIFGSPTYIKSDGSQAFTTDNNYVIRIWDLNSFRQVGKLEGHTNVISTIAQEKNRIATASLDNTIKLWDEKSFQLVGSLSALDSIDYFVQLPSTYYFASKNASKLLHYVTPQLNVVTFDQLDIKYNRPDLVLEAMGSKDTSLIQSYRKAYYKRLKKLGIDTTSFKQNLKVPEMDFMGRERIGYEQRGELLTLSIKGNDADYQLDRFNIWVNETPLFGLKGIDLRSRRVHLLDTTIKIKLSQGINVIETSVTNANGAESYRKPLTVYYTPERLQKERLHFIGIGVDYFKDAKQNLNYSVKDIRDLAVKFQQLFKEDIVIDTLFNQQVTAANVAALKKQLLATSVSDKVILAYSGHGLLSKDYDYYLSTYHVNFQKPEEDGLPYDALESLLDSIPARKKLMLIDACHSGEVDKEELQRIAAVNATAGGVEGAKGGTPLLLNTKKTGMKNSFELMQQLFVNVGRSTGATVISAAGGTQFALERGDLKNGVFTFSLLEYMQAHPTATVSELKNYVNKRVPELTKGAQQPTTRTEAKQVDWNVW